MLGRVVVYVAVSQQEVGQESGAHSAAMSTSLNFFARPGFGKQSAHLTISIPEGTGGLEDSSEMHYPPEAVQIRNTFIHIASPAAPESTCRAALSCPASHVGLIQQTMKDWQDDVKPAEGKPVICLEDALRPSKSLSASSELPSIGSSGHYVGDCKPCSFLHAPQGCRNGAVCMFCHLCDRSEKKRRQKIKRAALINRQRA